MKIFVILLISLLSAKLKADAAISVPEQLKFLKEATLVILIPKSLPKSMVLQEVKMDFSAGYPNLSQSICMINQTSVCCALRTGSDGLGDTSPVGNTIKKFEVASNLLGNVTLQLDTWAEGEVPSPDKKGEKWLVTQWYPMKNKGSKGKESSRERAYTLSCDYRPDVGLDEKPAIEILKNLINLN